MLINLSNHPSDKWGLEQTNAALSQFGHTEDMPFPQIDPEADTTEIVELSMHFATECIELFREYKQQHPEASMPNAVHVQGEFTFAHVIVNIFHKQGIKCLASTTKRIVKEEEGGIKTSVFEFVQFRPYYSE